MVDRMGRWMYIEAGLQVLRSSDTIHGASSVRQYQAAVVGHPSFCTEGW